MQQVVDVPLGIWPAAVTTPDLVLDVIGDYIRAKRNVALDQVAFEERRQDPSESFENFEIGLRRLAEVADLCATCFETRMVTEIIEGHAKRRDQKEATGYQPVSPSTADGAYLLQQRIGACKRMDF